MTARGMLACTLGLGALLPAAAQASVPDTYGLGSRAAAMAGAVTADAADFSGTYYNPAAVVSAPGVELSVGYMYFWQSLQVGEQDNDVADVHGLVGGLVAPGTLLGVPFAFSFATHLPDNGLSYIRARRQGVPRWELYDTRAQLLYLATDIAVRPLPWLELGGGIAFLSDTRGSFAIRGRADIIRPFDSQLQHEVDANLRSVRFPQAGLRLTYEDWGSLGVTYRGESKLDLQIDAHLEGIVEFAGIDVPLLYELEAKTVAAFTPQQVAMGLSFRKVEDLHINVDVTWLNWSAYVSPTATIRARLEADPPPVAAVELPDEPAPTKIIPPEFEDRFVPRFGIEYLGLGLGSPRKVKGVAKERSLVQIPLRAGYCYEHSPVPDQPGVTNLIDSHRHTVTLGTGVAVNAPIEELGGSLHLDLHAAWSILPERQYLKDSPADFIGDYHAAGTIFGLGSTLKAVF